MKVSDEFTVPLCRGHHRQLHQSGNEVAWWQGQKINALEIAKSLCEQTHASSVPGPVLDLDSAPLGAEGQWARRAAAALRGSAYARP